MSTAATRKMAGVVVSAGKMQRTVKVRLVKQEYNRHLRKNFSRPYNVLVNDPNSSVIEGDIVTLAPERHSKHVAHTIAEIVAPFGKPLDERPPLLTQAEREQLHADARARKLARKAGQEVPEDLKTTVETIIARRLAGAETDSSAESTAQVDSSSVEEDSTVEHGKGVVEEGVLESGKNQDQVQAEKQNAVRRTEEKVLRNEEDLEKAKARPQDEVARKALKQQS